MYTLISSMEFCEQLLLGSFSVIITFNKVFFVFILWKSILVSASENELSIHSRQGISFNNDSQLFPDKEDQYENTQISASVPEENTPTLVNVSKIITEMKHSDSHNFDEGNAEGNVLLPLTKLERTTKFLNSQNPFLKSNKNPLKFNPILARSEYESDPRRSSKEWQTSYSNFGPHNFSFVNLVPSQDINENVSPTVKESANQSKTSKGPVDFKFVQTKPFYFPVDQDSSEFRNINNRTMMKSEMEVTNINEGLNNETINRSVHPLQLNFSMEAILKIIKRERNIQIKILNELVLYLPVLFCDILLLVACWKLLHHIFQQISVRHQSQSLEKGFEDSSYSRSEKRLNSAESNTPDRYFLTNDQHSTLIEKTKKKKQQQKNMMLS